MYPSGERRKRRARYANIRPAKTVPGWPPRCGTDVDLVIVRENTEGFYADRNMFSGSGEFMQTPEVALAVRKVNRAGSLRITEEAFVPAMRHRHKVTPVATGPGDGSVTAEDKEVRTWCEPAGDVPYK